MAWISTEPAWVDVDHTRGDNATITFAHSLGASGNVAEARLMVRNRPDGDLILSLTKTANSSQWNFSTSNVGVISILPGDTDGRVAGDWYYDIELTHTNGTVTTFQKGRYYLRADIASNYGGDVLPGALELEVLLLQWTLTEAWAGTFTRDSDDVITTASITWPDGAGGTFTTVTKNSTYLAVDAFTATHNVSGLTVTQAAMTRNSNGSVTVRPLPTVS